MLPSPVPGRKKYCGPSSGRSSSRLPASTATLPMRPAVHSPTARPAVTGKAKPARCPQLRTYGNVATSTRGAQCRRQLTKPRAYEAAGDEAAGAAAIAAGDVHLVPVKNHVRTAPGEKQKPPLTLDRLVKEYATEQRQTTERAIRLGRLSDAWIRVQGERPENCKLDRPSAVKAICRALVEAKVDRRGASGKPIHPLLLGGKALRRQGGNDQLFRAPGNAALD